MRPRISIRGLVRPSVRWLVGPSVTLLSKSMKNGLLMISIVFVTLKCSLAPSHLYKRPCLSVGTSDEVEGGRGRSEEEREKMKKL